MTAVALQFDPASHRYSLEGRDLLSVTQVLDAAGFIDRQWFTDEAMARGTAVHAAVQAFSESGAVPSDDITAPFFDAYLAFKMASGFMVDAAEERVCDPILGYAGTLDLRGRFGQFAHGTDLIDIKTGTIPTWVRFQTAGYARLVHGGHVRRWALQLKADGTYRLEPLTNRVDEKVFLAALTVAQAQRGWL